MVPVGPAGPQGESGPTGPQGPEGPQGELGPQGPAGTTPTVTVGTVSSGTTAAVTANPTDTGISLDFVVPVGPAGPQGESGPTGPQGPEGPQGELGPQGPAGTTPTVTVGTVSSGTTAAVTANPTDTGISLDFVVPVGPAGPQGESGPTGPQGPEGPQGERGETGPQGELGPQGPAGTTPTVTVGTVSSGTAAAVTANPTDTGISLDFVVPVGPEGPKGEPGEVGPEGPQGIPGQTPEITVEQNIPTVYKVRFKTAETDFLTPNLKAVPEVYNANLSSAGSVLTVPLEALNMTLQNTSATSLRFSLQPAVTGTSIVADIRRASIYDGASIDSQTNDNLTISGVFVVDDLIYSQSQEMHWTRIRQQEPSTGLWSMCEIRIFSSRGGARTSVCVNWLYTGASFLAP